MLEYLLAARQTYQAYQVTRKRNTCIEPSRKTNSIEDLATLCHTEEKTKLTKSTSITQQRNNLTWTPQSASACQQFHVVSWVVSTTSLLWDILVAIKCNVKWKSNGHTHEAEESYHLKIHRKLKSHEGSPRVTRVKHHPWIYIPLPLYEQGNFTLASPT